MFCAVKKTENGTELSPARQIYFLPAATLLEPARNIHITN